MRLPSLLRNALCAAVFSASCGFPEVTFDTTASGGSGAAGGATGTSTSAAGGGGSGASAGGGNGGSGAGAGGGTTSTSSTGGGGSGGVGGGGSGGVGGGGSGGSGGGGSGGGTTTSSSTTTSTTGSGGAPCAEDADEDGFVAWCAGGPDCADEDPTANPAAGFDYTPILGETKPNTNPYDRNCDGSLQRETPVLDCSGLAPCGSAQGYQAAVACGQFGVLGKCVNKFLVGCAWSALSPLVEKQQKCK